MSHSNGNNRQAATIARRQTPSANFLALSFPVSAITPRQSCVLCQQRTLFNKHLFNKTCSIANIVALVTGKRLRCYYTVLLHGATPVLLSYSGATNPFFRTVLPHTDLQVCNGQEAFASRNAKGRF